MKIITADGNASWTRSLLSALPDGVDCHWLRLRSLGAGRAGLASAALRSLRAPIRVAADRYEHTRVIAGWGRAYRLSSGAVARWAAKVSSQPPRRGEVCVVYTVPQYAGVAALLRGRPGLRQIYYPYDWYQGYAWDVAAVERWEAELVQHCDQVIAISRRLAADFAAQGARKVLYLPNAASDITPGAPEKPHQLERPERGLLVGCIGQISGSYDWPLIEEVLRLRREDKFVFIGPILEPPGPQRTLIERVLSVANVCWTGPKPHAELPSYTKAFDVCWNPLAMTPFNDRRSPLRLYDYLATNKPVLSTPVSEAFAHLPHLIIAANAAETVSRLKEVAEGVHVVDERTRAEYISKNTWRVRAAELVRLLSGAEG